MLNENQIPKHWQIVVSSKILDIRDGTHDTPKYVLENGVPLITSKNLKENKIDFEKISFISKDDHLEISKRSKVEAGDILFAMIGTIGNPAIIKGDTNFSIKNVGLFKKNESVILPEYLVNFLRSSIFQKQLSERKLLKGTTQKFIPLGNLRNIEIPLPPLTEQQAIVSKIEELLSELEKGKEQLQTAQQQLKVYRQSLLKSAFEGKLTNKNVKDGELPKGWKWVKLGSLMESVRNGYSKKPDDSGKVKILRISSVRPNKINFDDIRFLENELDNLNRIQENDLLFTRYNGSIDFVGVCGRVTAIKENIYYPDKLIRCRPIINDKYHSTYIQYASNFGASRKYILSKIKTTAGQTGIAGSEIKEIPLLLPPLSEQQQIVEELESKLTVCDKIEETITNSLQQSEALRQSILKKAFEGKLV